MRVLWFTRTVAPGVDISVVARREIAARPWGPGVFASARLDPLAILIASAGGIEAASADGTRLSRAEILALCPEALAQLSATGLPFREPPDETAG